MKIIITVSLIVFAFTSFLSAYDPPKNTEDCACLKEKILQDLSSGTHEDKLYSFKQII